MIPKVLVTRQLPPETQARLLKQDFELIQWEKDEAIPRDILLDRIKGNKIPMSFHFHTHSSMFNKAWTLYIVY